MRLYSDPGNAPTTLIASSYPKIRRVNFTHLYQKLQIFSKYFTLTERNRPKKDPSGKKRLKKQLLRWKREREMVWNSIRKGRLSRMTRLSIRVGGRQRISHASSFHFIPRTSSGGLPPPLSREWRELEWFQRGRQRNGRYSSILRRFPWKTMQTRGRIPSSTQHLNRTTLVEWENRVIRPWIA